MKKLTRRHILYFCLFVAILIPTAILRPEPVLVIAYVLMAILFLIYMTVSEATIWGLKTAKPVKPLWSIMGSVLGLSLVIVIIIVTEAWKSLTFLLIILVGVGYAILASTRGIGGKR
jgi:hypothetical protein